MFVSFDPVLLLLWIVLANFIPGALVSFSILKKTELSIIEKLLIGLAIGIVVQPLIPFLLYLIAGIKYNYALAVASVAVFYVLALAIAYLNKLHENVKEIKLPTLPIGLEATTQTITPHLVSIILILILLATYLVRFGSYSPVFQELDPYYYTDAAHQLITIGENPWDDQTSWYPDVSVNHRSIPALSYLEATWYSLYTGANDYNNMLLADIASLYPPLAALLAVFFIYLLVSTATKREYGLIAAGIATFMPIFIWKLSAGEQEIQPYAFFALLFFYAMYVLTSKRKELVFPVLAGLAFAALSLGSATQILAVISMVLFIALAVVSLFLRNEKEELKQFLISNSIILAIGPIIASGIIRGMFQGGISFSMAVPFLLPLLLGAVLYLIMEKISQRDTALLAFAVIILAGIIAYGFTPVGEQIKSLGRSGFEITQYNSPLAKTIAEQGTGPSSFEGYMGFIGTSFAYNTYEAFASSSSGPISAIFGYLTSLISFAISYPFSLFANLVLGTLVAVANFMLGSSVAYSEKAPSLLLVAIAIFIITIIALLVKYIQKKEDLIFLLFLTLIMPPLVVGLLKTKYTIYAAVLIAVGIGFALGKLELLLPEFIPSKQPDNLKKSVFAALLIVGALLMAGQFFYNDQAPSLIQGSFLTLYQNNPTALAAKFQVLCPLLNDNDVCMAASDPMGYANKGTNYQYSLKLCQLSILSDPTNSAVPKWEQIVVSSRCQRLSTYWIDSMEWIRDNTPEGARITSWWDYGHWINYFGLRNAVIRNEHASHEMIGEVAHDYLDATTEELIQSMKSHDSEYALFDVELLSNGDSMGGKYGALNYLACAWDNKTTLKQNPGESECENSHLWENIFVAPDHSCVISKLTNKTGVIAYKIYAGSQYQISYPSLCNDPKQYCIDSGISDLTQCVANVNAYCSRVIRAEPTYCFGNVTLADGQTRLGTYYLNETEPNGDLKVNKALMAFPVSLGANAHMGQNVAMLTLFYTKDNLWLDNGQLVSGYEDRKGKFYDSALYHAFFLNELPGFDLVYSTSNGAVKIYKLKSS